MDFSLSDEQVLLQDSVQRFIQNDYSFALRQKLIKSEAGFSQKNWQQFADLGWLALPFAEECGGIGGGRQNGVNEKLGGFDLAFVKSDIFFLGFAGKFFTGHGCPP